MKPAEYMVVLDQGVLFLQTEKESAELYAVATSRSEIAGYYLFQKPFALLAYD